MKENYQKQPYEAPELTVVSFKVEQGFVGSGPFGSLIFWDHIIEDIDDEQQVEDYTTGHNWHSGSNHFWD